MRRFGPPDRLRRARRSPSSSRRRCSRTTARSSSASSALYLIALLGLEHPDRVHRPDLARPRSIHGDRRLHDDDPRRRPRLARPLDDPGRRADRRRVRPPVRPAGDALRRAVPRARDVRDPSLVHRPAQALLALHRRERRQEPAPAAPRVRAPRKPVGVVLRRVLDGRARHVPALVLDRPWALRTLPAGGPGQRDRVDGERHLDRHRQDRSLRHLGVLLRHRRGAVRNRATPT